jgi:hypothetical protein
MTTTTSHLATLPQLSRKVPQAGHGSHTGLRHDSRVSVALALAVALLALIAFVASGGSTISKVRALPPAERAAVLQRALGNLRDVCLANDRPREFCKEQAELALALPECTGACQSMAREELRADSAVK